MVTLPGIWSGGGSDVKASAYNVGDLDSIPGSGRFLEKEMATHFSSLAWKIPWTEEPGRLQSMEPQRVRHDWAHTHVHMHVNMLQWLTECFKIFYSHLSAKCIGPLILWVTVTECISFTSVCCSTVWRNKIFKDIKADFRELLVVQWSLFPSFESNK